MCDNTNQENHITEKSTSVCSVFLNPNQPHKSLNTITHTPGKKKKDVEVFDIKQEVFLYGHTLTQGICSSWQMRLRCQSSVCIFHREKKRKEISVFSFESAVRLIRYLRLNLQNLCSALSLPTGMLNRYTAHHPTFPKDKDCYQNVSGEEIQSDPKLSATAI